MTRILTTTLIGAGFLAGGFFVGTQLAVNPPVALLAGGALVFAAIALNGSSRKRRKSAAPAPQALEATA